uniref:Uncharacterized protein n=1 Tax=Lepeophtheirus salmonis TaxID=72036 RepID=A0A0K2TH00_LEPSM
MKGIKPLLVNGDIIHPGFIKMFLIPLNLQSISNTSYFTPEILNYIIGMGRI